MKYYSYLNTAVSILQSYHGEVPFSIFIKKFFSANKKYGSKDRKAISTLCYHYFRLGHAVSSLSTQEKIIAAAFLCEEKPSAFLEKLKPQWNEAAGMSAEEKIALINNGFSVNDIFPWKDELSETVDAPLFAASFLKQPLLYLRTRPGKEMIVKEKLTAAGLLFEEIDDACIALPNNSGVDAVIELDKEAVVQDLNSQKISGFMHEAVDQHKPISAWDCCAASGGKSILLYDLLKGNLDLSVSDIRPSIINNLRERFKTAGIKKYKSFISDLSSANCQLPAANYDLILCDAPCSGSGTWARTPENLCFFKKEKIEYYAALQKKIVSNAIRSLKPGGCFIYITCSVFKKENEAVAAFIKNEFHLLLLQMELLKGYEKKADNMFAAVFKKG